ncbi:Acetoacetyl-CoA synthetase [Cyphellophora attinorum]|uniref:Acetoacetyl-CoA synthetase n=1 Tax=Cyphellophora attinorum TaxID=1664694 RepID=A0A0N1H1M9_9EURO|nr:Acetoacetyl-CoA synthetase [Phialophora attinorum]KPI38070.1 Acetoacetyl-CoA synthetase [Phialophora attinorum]
MEAAGVKTGDRVAGYLANHANTVIAMLAATSLGALWTGVSPDTGVQAVLDRLTQIEPVLIFADNCVAYNMKNHPTHVKVSEVVSKLPSLKDIVIFETIPGQDFDISSLKTPGNAKAQAFKDFLAPGDSARKLTFKPLPPDHPVYILYSSGTTGTPKGIVHGALGTLLQHKKEHQLQCDILPASESSTSQHLEIQHFGTSAKYLSVLEQAGTEPRTAQPKSATLETLKSIFSTGSPLAPSTFQYVYDKLAPKKGLLLGRSLAARISVVSLFGAPSPLLPVHRGEIQCRGLGMAVHTFDASGKDITSSGQPGELVCTVPFPCQPVMFWPPGPAGEKRYKGSYFETFEVDGKRIWHHGDFVRFNPKTGGIHMLGRSDGVLNRVEDALCIGRKREADPDEVVVLFVKMAQGQEFSQELVKGIQSVVRKELSARHVPAVIEETPEIPYTMNGKKVEGAVKQILCGLNIKTSASVANAECLEFYRRWAAEH